MWQLPSRLRAAQKEAARTGESLVQRGLDLVRDVRLAHAEAVLATDRLRLRREAEGLWRETANLVAVQARAGEVPESEAAGVLGEADAAHELAARSDREARLADDRLRLLLGLTGATGPQWAFITRAKPPGRYRSRSLAVSPRRSSRAACCRSARW